MTGDGTSTGRQPATMRRQLPVVFVSTFVASMAAHLLFGRSFTYALALSAVNACAFTVTFSAVAAIKARRDR